MTVFCSWYYLNPNFRKVGNRLKVMYCLWVIIVKQFLWLADHDFLFKKERRERERARERITETRGRGEERKGKRKKKIKKHNWTYMSTTQVRKPGVFWIYLFFCFWSWGTSQLPLAIPGARSQRAVESAMITTGSFCSESGPQWFCFLKFL